MLGEVHVDELLLRFLPPCYDAFVVRFLALLLQHMGRLGSVISMNIYRLMQENSDDETSDAGSVEMDGNRVLKVLICFGFYTMHYSDYTIHTYLLFYSSYQLQGNQ